MDFLPKPVKLLVYAIVFVLILMGGAKAMGWFVLVALKPLLRALPWAGFVWLLLGGLFYTFGIVFYGLDAKLRHAHGVWHLFVLAGSISHYIAIYLYVA